MDETKYTSDVIARATMRAIEKSRLYVLPQTDARINWYLKRLSPSLFNRLFGWMYKKSTDMFAEKLQSLMQASQLA